MNDSGRRRNAIANLIDSSSIQCGGCHIHFITMCRLSVREEEIKYSSHY